MTATHIDDVRRGGSARDYWNVGGIPTLLGAALYLATVGFLVVLVLNRKRVLEFLGKPPAAFMVLIAILLIGALRIWVLLNWEEMIEWLKVRISYPRIGYVTLPGCWQDESTRPATLQRKSRFWRVLSALSGFWFWSFLIFFLEICFGSQGVMHSRRILMLLLGVLVAIRGMRFGIYREGRVPGDGHEPGILLQVVQFLWSVLNSFWVWIFLVSLLVLLPHGHSLASHLYPLLCLLGAGFVLGQSFSLFPVLLPKVDRFQTASLFLCGIGCAFLLWRNLPTGIVATLLTPGLWAASSGGLSLYRYLRDNRYGQYRNPLDSKNQWRRGRGSDPPPSRDFRNL